MQPDGGGTDARSADDTEREDREVRAAIASAIDHMETIESSLEPFDARENRGARLRLEKVLERLREDARSEPEIDRSGEGSS